MLKATRANVVLRIPDDEMERYLTKGYDIYDELGNVVKKTTPTSYNELKKLYDELVVENTQLKEEIEKLKSTSKKEVKLVDEVVDEEPLTKKKSRSK